MSNTIDIQAIDIYGLQRISSAAPQTLATTTMGGDLSVEVSTSSIVQLSVLGKLWAASSSLESSLIDLQTNTSGTTQSLILAEAQSFVEAFNEAQQSLSNTLPFLATMSENNQIAQFAQAMNSTENSVTGTENQGISSLQAIGITFITSSTMGLAGATTSLSIDQEALKVAIASNPEETRMLLAQATQSLLEQVTAFQIQMANASGFSSAYALQQGSGLTSDDIQNLNTAELLKKIQLTFLARTALGLDPNRVQTADAIREVALNNGLSATDSTNDLTTLAKSEPGIVTQSPSTTNDVVSPSTATPSLAAAGTSDITNQIDAQSAPVSTAETLTSTQAVSDATLSIRQQVADSVLQSLILDPSYAAYIASSHMKDFTSPTPLKWEKASWVEVPTAILPIYNICAIGSYTDAANSYIRN